MKKKKRMTAEDIIFNWFKTKWKKIKKFFKKTDYPEHISHSFFGSIVNRCELMAALECI